MTKKKPDFEYDKEMMFKSMQKIMSEKNIKPEDMNSYFSDRTFEDIRQEAEDFTITEDTNIHDLFDIIYSSEDPAEIIKCANQILDQEPNNLDAHLILIDQLAMSDEEELMLLEEILTKTEKEFGTAFFKENKGHFWLMLETRPYMRAKSKYAMLLWELRRQGDAIKTCWELLDLNPNDNQGIRYILFSYLLTDNRVQETAKLLKQYNDDPSAHWVYNLALYYFKKEGDSNKANAMMKKALKANPYVVELMFEKVEGEEEEEDLYEELPDSFRLGSEEEAISYLASASLAWGNSPAALQWLFSYSSQSAI